MALWLERRQIALINVKLISSIALTSQFLKSRNVIWQRRLSCLPVIRPLPTLAWQIQARCMPLDHEPPQDPAGAPPKAHSSHVSETTRNRQTETTPLPHKPICNRTPSTESARIESRRARCLPADNGLGRSPRADTLHDLGVCRLSTLRRAGANRRPGTGLCVAIVRFR